MSFYHLFANKFSVKIFCSMIIWFWCKIISSLFCYYKFNVSMFVFFFTFSIFFLKTELFIKWKKSFSKLFFAFCLSSVFISIYGFSQTFSLNLIALWAYFKINPWINACFKFFMWMKYSVLSCNLVTWFSTFWSFILSGKNGK